MENHFKKARGRIFYVLYLFVKAIFSQEKKIEVTSLLKTKRSSTSIRGFTSTNRKFLILNDLKIFGDSKSNHMENYAMFDA